MLMPRSLLARTVHTPVLPIKTGLEIDHPLFWRRQIMNSKPSLMTEGLC
jgi:hypothetical protein